MIPYLCGVYSLDWQSCFGFLDFGAKVLLTRTAVMTIVNAAPDDLGDFWSLFFLLCSSAGVRHDYQYMVSRSKWLLRKKQLPAVR